MSFETLPNSSAEMNEDHHPNSERQPVTGQTEGAGAEQERFGWNDIIVPEEHLKITKKVIKECGYELKSESIPGNRQYLDGDPRKQAFDEFLISITYPGDHKPVDRDALKRIIAALRNAETHVIVRVARLAPGEHFG